MNAVETAVCHQSLAEKFGNISENRTFLDIVNDENTLQTIREVIQTYVCKHYKLDISDSEAALAHRDNIDVLSQETTLSLTQMGMNPVSIACLKHVYSLHTQVSLYR